ncbi:MAG TPA: response regulator [Syntrophorhabdales bacterium]|nr:response regulator [Syntrophorhabdales bacterium]
MKEKVIFVDDDPLVLSGLRRALREYSELWDAQYVSTIADAERLFSTQAFDVAVVDVFMPLKNGLELLKEIKSDPSTSHTEVIVLTGMQDNDLVRKALEMGAVEVLSKPVDTERLVATIAATLKSVSPGFAVRR